MSFCFEALESAKISSYEPVSSQKYENGYRTKFVTLQYLFFALLWGHLLYLAFKRFKKSWYETFSYEQLKNGLLFRKLASAEQQHVA